MTKSLEETAERSRREMKHAIVVMCVTFFVVILIGAIYWIAHRSWF